MISSKTSLYGHASRQMMSFFIVYKSKISRIEKEVCESEQHFLSRVEFMILALDFGLQECQAETLGYAYRNKLQSYIAYPKETEELINKINQSGLKHF